MTLIEANQQLKNQLITIYDERESKNITSLIIENITGFNRVNQLLNKQNNLTSQQINILNYFAALLLKNKPVQYVLNEAWFAGMKFYVDENVLIPRPETEELVDWIISDIKTIHNFKTETISILDIGTGSGCIALALKKKIKTADVSALDISEEALRVAARNAKANSVNIDFLNADITKEKYSNNFKLFDIIVSNPPYIVENETNNIENNILLYEPFQALFVPNNNPLIFYNCIANFANTNLKKNGNLYFEINEAYGKEVCNLLDKKKFQAIKIKNDLQGKDRMVKATKP